MANNTNLNRRAFFKSTLILGAASMIFVSQPSNAIFFIAMAKAYGEKMGWAAKPPIDLSWDYLRKMIDSCYSSRNSDNEKTKTKGQDLRNKASKDLDENELKRAAEPAPMHCESTGVALQLSSLMDFTYSTQSALFEDGNLGGVKTEDLNSLPSDFQAHAETLAKSNSKKQALDLSDNILLKEMFDRASTITGSEPTPKELNEYVGPPNARLKLARAALKAFTGNAISSEGYVNSQYSSAPLSSEQWRAELNGRAHEAGGTAELIRMTTIRNHQLNETLLKHESLMLIEALSLMDLTQKFDKSLRK